MVEDLPKHKSLPEKAACSARELRLFRINQSADEKQNDFLRRCFALQLRRSEPDAVFGGRNPRGQRWPRSHLPSPRIQHDLPVWRPSAWSCDWLLDVCPFGDWYFGVLGRKSIISWKKMEGGEKTAFWDGMKWWRETVRWSLYAVKKSRYFYQSQWKCLLYLNAHKKTE